MSTIEEIKTAVAKVSQAERRELQRWLDSLSDGELWTERTLCREIELGLKDAEEGRVSSFDAAGLRELSAEIKRAGRQKLSQQPGK